MISPSHLLSAFLILGIFSQVAAQSLAWEKTTLEIAPVPHAREVVGQFRFENRGSKTITVATLRPSCECTVAALDKRVYLPGESGLIEAVFTIGDRSGPQEKHIQVITDEGSAGASTMLTLRVLIPDFVSLSSRVLRWRLNGPSSAQSLRITALEDRPIRSVTVRQAEPDFADIRIEPITSGKEYAVVISPRSTERLQTSTTSLQVEFADGDARSVQFVSLVR